MIIHTVQDVRKELFYTEKRLRNYKMKNKLSKKYLTKISYMLMHLRMYPCKKLILDNWHMPDYSDIQKLKKENSKGEKVK